MKRAPLPDVCKDEALNKFITDTLMNARGQVDTPMLATLIERTVEQLRKFFPEAYAQPAGGDDSNVQAWPKLAGSA